MYVLMYVIRVYILVLVDIYNDIYFLVYYATICIGVEDFSYTYVSLEINFKEEV